MSPQSTMNIGLNKWQAHTRRNSGEELPSGKGLFSYRSNKNSSKPFVQKTIIEEVTKEHFFTRDSKMYKPDESSLPEPTPTKFNL